MYINLKHTAYGHDSKSKTWQIPLRKEIHTGTVKNQVSNWINCHDHIPDKHLIAIIKLFPELNANWLLRGVGSMIIDQQQLRQINRNEFGFCENCVDKDKEISMLKELLEKKENELRQLYRESGKLEERLYQYEKRKS